MLPKFEPTGGDIQATTKKILLEHIKKQPHVQRNHSTFSIDEIYIVWFSKTLQNWKALLGTTLPDGMYYEITYNGDRKEAYIDTYHKIDNTVVDIE